MAFFLVGFRCHHLCAWHVQLPGLPCLCAPTLAVWWWKGLSKWKRWALHSRLWYEHSWGCLWKKAAAASSDSCFCSTHHITFSLTFPIPGLIRSIRINQVGCRHHRVQQPLQPLFRVFPTWTEGLPILKLVLMHKDFSLHSWDNLTTLCMCVWWVCYFLFSIFLHPPTPHSPWRLLDCLLQILCKWLLWS